MSWRTRPVTVVLADDSAIYRRGLERAMEARSDIALVAAVDNGNDALLVIREHRPRVVILDLIMPGLDGIAVWDRLGAQVHDPQSPTRALLLSAGLDADISARAMAAGIDRCLGKSESRSTICDAVVALGGGRPALVPASG